MNIKMKELPLSERPYEKLERYGAKALTNAELLAIIIKTGTKEDTAVGLAQKILKLNEGIEKESLFFIQDISIADYMKIKGIGKVKAIQLLAVCELAKRINQPTKLMNELRCEKRETAKLILLNSKNMVMGIKDVSYGGTNFAMIEPKEILSEAIKMQAPKIILVHNHPSGDVTPSKADYRITDKLYEASELLGIQLLDHVIIGDNRYESVFGAKEENKNEF